MADAKTTGGEAFVEDLKMKFKFELGDDWDKIIKGTVDIGISLAKAVKNFEALAKVQDIFTSSAQKTFKHSAGLFRQLSKRVVSVTKDFSFMNIAMETAGGVSDVLGFKWKELGNAGSRWFSLMKATGPILKLAAAYKILSTLTGILADTFYKAGQALADNVIAQEKSLEYTAILGKETGILTHRMVELGEVRVFAQAGKDLSNWGKLWRATTNFLATSITVIEGVTLKVINLATSFLGVGVAIETVSKGLNLLTNGFNTAITGMTPAIEKAFSPKIFQDSDEALTHFRENLATWAADTKMSKEDIAIPMVSLARATGDASLAVTVLTSIMGAGFKREQVNVRELMNLMKQLGTGAGISTKTLRVLNSEIDTSSVKFLDASNSMKQMIYNMTKGDSAETTSIFNKITDNAIASMNMLETTLGNFMAASVTNLNKLYAEYERIGKLQKTSIEERLKYKDLGNQIAQAEQRNLAVKIGLLESQLSLQKQVGGVSGSSESLADVQKVAAAKKALTRAVKDNDKGLNKEAVTQRLTELNAILAASIDNDRKRIEAYVSNTQRALAVLQETKFSLFDTDKADAFSAISSKLATTQKRSWELSKQQLAVEQKLAMESKEAGNDRSAKILRYISHVKDLRDVRIGALNEYKDSIAGLHNLQMMVHGDLANLEETTMKRKTDNAKREMVLLKDLHAKAKGNISERLRLGKEMLALNMRIKREGSDKLASASQDIVAFRGAGVQAEQMAYGKNLSNVAEKARDGGFGELERQLSGRMSGVFQDFIKANMELGLAQQQEAIVPEVNKALTATGNDFVKASKLLVQRFSGNQQGLEMAIRMLSQKTRAASSSAFASPEEKLLKNQRDLLEEQKELVLTDKARQEKIDTQLDELATITSGALKILGVFEEESGKADGDSPTTTFKDNIKYWKAVMDKLNVSLDDLRKALFKIAEMPEGGEKDLGKAADMANKDVIVKKSTEAERAKGLKQGKLSDKQIAHLYLDEQPIFKESLSGFKEDRSYLMGNNLKNWLPDAKKEMSKTLIAGGENKDDFASYKKARSNLYQYNNQSEIMAKDTMTNMANNFIVKLKDGIPEMLDIISPVHLIEKSLKQLEERNLASGIKHSKIEAKKEKETFHYTKSSKTPKAATKSIEAAEIKIKEIVPPSISIIEATPIKLPSSNESLTVKDEKIITEKDDGLDKDDIMSILGVAQDLKSSIANKDVDLETIKETKVNPVVMDTATADKLKALQDHLNAKNTELDQAEQAWRKRTTITSGITESDKDKSPGYMKIVTDDGKVIETKDKRTLESTIIETPTSASKAEKKEESKPVETSGGLKDALAMLTDIVQVLKDGFVAIKGGDTPSGEKDVKGGKNGEVDIDININEYKSDITLAQLIAEKIRAKRLALA